MCNLVILVHRPHSKEWFENLLETLSRHYHFVPLAEIIEYYTNGKSLKNACHITFDDGEKSVFEEAYPVLLRKGIPATLFVSPKIIDSEVNYWFQEIKQINSTSFFKAFASEVSDKVKLKKFSANALLKSQNIDTIKRVLSQCEFVHNYHKFNMTTAELVELSNSGVFEIGAHTMNHPILSNEDYLTSKNEIIQSIDVLESMLQKQISSFAYPNGLPGVDYSEREIEILKESRVSIAFSCRYGRMNSDDNIYEVPRLEIESGGHRKVLLKAKFLSEILNIYHKTRKSGPYNERKRIKKIINNN